MAESVSVGSPRLGLWGWYPLCQRGRRALPPTCEREGDSVLTVPHAWCAVGPQETCPGGPLLMTPEGGWAYSCLSFPSRPCFFSRGEEPRVPWTRRRTRRAGAGQEAPEGVREENSLPADGPCPAPAVGARSGSRTPRTIAADSAPSGTAATSKRTAGWTPGAARGLCVRGTGLRGGRGGFPCFPCVSFVSQALGQRVLGAGSLVCVNACCPPRSERWTRRRGLREGTLASPGGSAGGGQRQGLSLVCVC